MKQRIITAVVAFFVLLPVLIFSDTFIFPLGLAVCAVLSVWEMFACVGLKNAWLFTAPMYVLGAAFPFLIRYLPDRDLLAPVAICAAVVWTLYAFTVLIFSHGKYPLEAVFVASFSLFYIFIGFNAILFIHDCEPGGKYLYYICFLGAWITDIFAYFCGRAFGKHKLIPDVSPKKTVEGSIGGTVFCILVMVIFGFVVEKLVPEISANLLIFAVAGVLIAVVSQIGDLSMSVIKRKYGVKDYGFIFPGHGGVLDRFDSVIAVSALLMVFSLFFNFFELA
jgi:cytidylyltransferase family